MDKLDDGQKRGVIIFDFNKWSFDFIEMKVPKLVYLEINSKDDLDFSFDKNDYVYCSVISSLEKDVRRKLDDLKAIYFLRVKKERGFFIRKFFEKVSDRIEDLIKEFISSKDIPDKKSFLDIGLKIWRNLDDSFKED